MQNKNKKYSLIIYIGRFQPYHIGHLKTIEYAGTLSDHVLVLIGSANGPRTIRNPWTYAERVGSISDAVNQLDTVPQVHYEGLNDYSYNDTKWIQQVGEKVGKYSQRGDKIAVIGHDKDHTSSYLNYFPQWEFIEMPAYPAKGNTIDSTKIRQLMFGGQVPFTDGVLPKIAYGTTQVRQLMENKVFTALQAEWDYIEDYKKRWEGTPYPVPFVTVDACVIQSGHVLLIRRGHQPGKGLWAMPGGFVNNNEHLQEAILRELREETKLKVPEKVLKGSIAGYHVFDDPERSLRGRTFSHTYFFKLDDASSLPKVKGSDDAAEAQWFPLTEFEKMQSIMFEDHFSIIQYMLGKA